jgi:UrcA family protein
MMKTVTLALLLLTATASAASAAPEAAPGRSVHVTFADLDLSRASGRATLERRVDLAVHRVCPEPATLDLRALAANRACRRSALAGAREQLATVYGQSRFAGAAVHAVAKN